MYCDFCGNKIHYNVRYCRKCGRQLRDRSGDTQPIPVIDEKILRSTRGQPLGSAPWYKRIFPKKAPTNRSKVERVMYYLASVAMIGGLIYILATFQTIKEYQRLTTILGGLLAIYSWWKR
ncbi:MAG: hypothetical protein H6Q68_553 [Firmicutes bacterium]|nr:hypothetical protein [Bacillota bacterium]